MEYTWNYLNRESEEWQHDKFDTIEECIADARDNYGILTGDAIAVGTLERYEVSLDADIVLGYLEEDAYEQYGEFAESWNPTAAKREDREQLSEDITQKVKEWLERHNEMPKFFTVRNIKTVDVN